MLDGSKFHVVGADGRKPERLKQKLSSRQKTLKSDEFVAFDKSQSEFPACQATPSSVTLAFKDFQRLFKGLLKDQRISWLVYTIKWRHRQCSSHKYVNMCEITLTQP